MIHLAPVGLCHQPLSSELLSSDRITSRSAPAPINHNKSCKELSSSVPSAQSCPLQFCGCKRKRTAGPPVEWPKAPAAKLAAPCFSIEWASRSATIPDAEMRVAVPPSHPSVVVISTRLTLKNTLAVRILRGSFFLVLALIASYLPRLLGLAASTQDTADIAAMLALFVQGVIWTNIIVSYYVQRYITLHTRDGSSITTFKALGVVARLSVWIILGVYALSRMGIEIKPLLTGLGIGGLAVALAVQNILGDLFAAIAIVVDKPFVVGDAISVENYRGKVEHIGLKTTRVRSESGEQIIFANGELLKSKIRNYSR